MANLNLNKVVVGGRLTADPELRSTSSGVHTVGFSIAINGRGHNAKVEYIDIVAWRGLAETVCKYFKKGSSIVVSGRLSTRSWTDANNVKRQKVEVVADDVMFVDGRSDNNETVATNVTEESSEESDSEAPVDPDECEPLPF
jgi:single-strand DNA-binding protein